MVFCYLITKQLAILSPLNIASTNLCWKCIIKINWRDLPESGYTDTPHENVNQDGQPYSHLLFIDQYNYTRKLVHNFETIIIQTDMIFPFFVQRYIIGKRFFEFGKDLFFIFQMPV